MKGVKPINRSKTYYIISSDCVTILGAREEVPKVHCMEVESCAIHVRRGQYQGE